MREIKFRAWDKENRKIIYPSSLLQVFANIVDGSLHVDARFELMQFTGLKDKNGTDIFEGDVVSYDGKGREIVGFEDGCFWVGLKGEYPAPLYAQMGIDSMAVDGNIWENGDLLK